MQDSTEVPDDETTVSCTNLLKTLNFLKKKNTNTLHWNSWRWNYCIVHESFRNTELPEWNNTEVFFSWQLCNEGSVGMKISLFLVVIMA